MVRLPGAVGEVVGIRRRPSPVAAGARVGLLVMALLVVPPVRGDRLVDGRPAAPATRDDARITVRRDADRRSTERVDEPEDDRFQVHTHPAEPLGEDAYRNAPADVVLWGDLARALVVRRGSTFQTTFLPPVLALNGKIISIVGYVTPILEKDKAGKQFLLSSHSFLCDACEPPAPTELVEVNTRQAVIARYGVATIRGRFEVVRNDPHGLAYRLNEAVILKHRAR